MLGAGCRAEGQYQITVLGGAPPSGAKPLVSSTESCLSVRVFTLNPMRSGYSLTVRSALFPRLQLRLKLVVFATLFQ